MDEKYVCLKENIYVVGIFDTEEEALMAFEEEFRSDENYQDFNNYSEWMNVYDHRVIKAPYKKLEMW